VNRRLPLACAFALFLGGCTLATTAPQGPPPPADLPPPSAERPLPAPPPPPAGEPVAEPPTPVRVEGPAAPAAPTGLRPLPATLPLEVRALWVVRTSLVHPDSVRAVVHRAHAAGFNTLLVQVRGRGDAWYRSTLEPRADQLAHLDPAFDPLDLLIREAGPRGIQVHAWVNVNLVASAELLPTDPLHLLRRAPDRIALPRELAVELAGTSPWDPRWLDRLAAWTRANGDRVEGIYQGPSLRENHRHVEAVIGEILARYPLAGVHLDYVRHPSSDFDYGPLTLAEFRRWLEERGRLRAGAPTGPDLALPDDFPEAWSDFRRERMTELVAGVSGLVRARDPGILLSAAVFAEAADARNHRFQAWEEWLAHGLVDVVVPMAYTDADAIFERQLRHAAAVAGPERVWAGIGVYRNSFSGAVAKGRISRTLGLGGSSLFSYDWAVGPEGSAAAGTGPGGFLLRWGHEAWPAR
jgi:uncharacterized lipoprotein YddW (UPF0748 family)